MIFVLGIVSSSDSTELAEVYPFGIHPVKYKELSHGINLSLSYRRYRLSFVKKQTMDRTKILLEMLH